MFKFIRTYLVVFLVVGIFGCISGKCVEVNDFKDIDRYGFRLVSTDNYVICINSEIQIRKLVKVNPKLETGNIKLEIEKENLVRINGISENSSVKYVVLDSSICSVRKKSVSEYILCGLKDGSTVVNFEVNENIFPLHVNVWHECNYGEWVVKENSTCIKEGVRTRYCKICNKEEKSTINKIPHQYKDCICDMCHNVRYVNEEDREVILTESLCIKNGIRFSGDVVVPKYVTKNSKKYKVVGLGTGLFINNKDITSIDLPDTIRYIGDFAFDGCEKLSKCVMREGIGYIGDAAFQCCYNLEKLDLPSSVWFIGNFAFNHNSELRNSVIALPDDLEYLGEDTHYPAHMFYDCGERDSFKSFSISKDNEHYKVENGILYTKDGETLVSIPVGKEFDSGIFKIPDGVENLGELSFSRNKNVKEVVIPDSLNVKSKNSDIENRYYLNNGNSLSVGCYGYSGVERYNCCPNSNKYRCIDGVLYSKDLSKLIAVPNQYKGDLIIPEGVKQWSCEAIWSEVKYFKGIAMNGIKSITIPSSIESIDTCQVEVINELVETYEVMVVSNSSKYDVSNGYLVCK